MYIYIYLYIINTFQNSTHGGRGGRLRAAENISDTSTFRSYLHTDQSKLKPCLYSGLSTLCEERSELSNAVLGVREEMRLDLRREGRELIRRRNIARLQSSHARLEGRKLHRKLHTSGPTRHSWEARAGAARRQGHARRVALRAPDIYIQMSRARELSGRALIGQTPSRALAWASVHLLPRLHILAQLEQLLRADRHGSTQGK